MRYIKVGVIAQLITHSSALLAECTKKYAHRKK